MPPNGSPSCSDVRLNKLISFHAYEIVTTCTEHGVLSAESNGRCKHCGNKREGELLGKLYKRRQLVLKRTRYKEFFNDFYLPCLLKYRWHRFHMTILGKRHTGNNRQMILSMVNSILFKTLLKDLHFDLTMRFNLSTSEALALSH